MTTGRILWISLATFFFPGFGHALFSRRVAIAWFVATALAAAAMIVTIYGVFASLAVITANAIHVLVRLVRARQRGLPRPGWTEPIVFVVAGAMLFGALKTQLEAFRIPSSAMVPSILVGEHVMAEKLRAPQRGDVIVFRMPCEPRRTYIKRLVAVAGDTVEVRCTRLFLNGAPVPDELVAAELSFDDEIKPGEQVARRGSHYRETIAGHTFDVLHQIPRATEPTPHDFPGDDAPPPSCSTSDGLVEDALPQPTGTVVVTKETAGACEPHRHFVVPPGALFVMGDNRENSNDSRFWGVVPESAVVGRAVGVWFPLAALRNF